VGYPIFYDFNVLLLTYIYYLVVLVFPTLALLLYLGSTRLGIRLRLMAPARAALPVGPDEPWAPQWTRTAAAGRVLGAGALFGLEVAVIFNATEAGFFGALLGTAAGYAMLASGGAYLAGRLTGGGTAFLSGLARINAAAVPLCIIGLFLVSATVGVEQLVDDTVRHFPWIPWWLAVGVTGAALGWVWWRGSRATTEADHRAVERATLLYLAVPVALLLILGFLPGALGRMDVFHEGEHLGAAHLTSLGWFPWRDLISTHGPLEDSLFPLLSIILVEDSRWGDWAAQTLLLIPLTFVSLYLLAAWAFKRNWAFVSAIAITIAGSKLLLAESSQVRYVFWPLMLVLLGVVLIQGRRWLSALLGIALVAQAVLVPELTYCIPACAIVVVLYDLAHRPAAMGISRAFQRTLWCLIGGMTAALGLAVLLLWQHALGDFLFYYRIFAPGHALTGGLPLDLHSYLERPSNMVVVASPVVALLLGFWYYATMLIRRRPLQVIDWVMGAAGIFALIFYTRFLDRADMGHAYLAYRAALPLMAFLLFIGVTALDRGLRRLRWPGRLRAFSGRPASVALLLVTLLAVGGPALKNAAASPADYRPVVVSPPDIQRLGYSAYAFDLATYDDLNLVLQAYLGPGDWLFDFSNEPGLFYYLLGLEPQTRYFHISMAIPEAAQKDVIAELERHQPRLVVLSNDAWLGLPSWDGIPNSVRHYDVSQYLLDHYRPLLSTHTQVLYGLATAELSPATALGLRLREPPVTDNLYFRSHICDWGYTPNFLSISPPPPVHPVAPITLSPGHSAHDLMLTGWAGDTRTGQPAQQIVVMGAGGQVAGQAPTVERLDVVDALGIPGWRMSGFRLKVGRPEAGLRVFGISSTGVASELHYGPGSVSLGSTASPVHQIQLTDGSVVPVVRDVVNGYVDQASAPYQIDLILPSGTNWSQYRWLEITGRSGLARDGWSVSDRQTTEPDHMVAFKTLQGHATRYLVPIGSCPQWHGYGPGPLYLDHGSPQDIVSVRLLP
jgi:hypothetical protein